MKTNAVSLLLGFGLVLAPLAQAQSRCYLGGNSLFPAGLITVGENYGTWTKPATMVDVPLGTAPNLFPDPQGIQAVAPGEAVLLMGKFFFPSNGPGIPSARATSAVWPTALNNAELLVNGTPAPLNFVGPRLDGNSMALNANEAMVAQLPFGLQGSTVTLQLRITGMLADPAATCVGPEYTVSLVNAAIGIAANAAGNFLEDSANGNAVNPMNVRAGQKLTTYFIGGGNVVDPEVVAGSPANQAAELKQRLAVAVDGNSAYVEYGGVNPAYPGLYQANFSLPAGLTAGAHQLTLTVGTSSQTVPITVVQ